LYLKKFTQNQRLRRDECRLETPLINPVMTGRLVAFRLTFMAILSLKALFRWYR
jgi:hypothetical protein